MPDDRPEAKQHVTAAVKPLVQLRGGIIGAVELTECKRYHDLTSFLADQALHLNAPDWFEPNLYGMTFAKPERLPFRAYPGWFRFFRVEAQIEAQPQPAASHHD